MLTCFFSRGYIGGLKKNVLTWKRGEGVHGGLCQPTDYYGTIHHLHISDFDYKL